MRRGINFGGDLDGDGGGWIEERHFDIVRDAGFDTVRLPVKWSGRRDGTPSTLSRRSRSPPTIT